MVIVLNTDKYIDQVLVDKYQCIEVFLYNTRKSVESDSRYILSDYKNLQQSLFEIISWFDVSLITKVICIHEYGIPLMGYLNTSFHLDGMPIQDALAFTNKYLMKRRLVEKGIPVAKFSISASMLKDNDRVVNKAFFGAGCEGVTFLSKEDKSSFFNEGYFEEYLNVDNEYHVDGVIKDGEIQSISKSKYFKPPIEYRNGSVTGSCSLPDDSQISSKLEQLFGATTSCLGNYNGVYHLEVLELMDGSLFVGEIAARPAGGGIPKYLNYLKGICLFQDAIEVHFDKKTAPFHRRPQSPFLWFTTPVNYNAKNNDWILNLANDLKLELLEIEVHPAIDTKVHSCSRLNNSTYYLKAADFESAYLFVESINNEFQAMSTGDIHG